MAEFGSRLKTELIAARRDSGATPSTLAAAEYRLRDVYSRWQDASKRDRAAKVAENERRRERWNAPEAQARREAKRAEQATALALIDRVSTSTNGATS